MCSCNYGKFSNSFLSVTGTCWRAKGEEIHVLKKLTYLWQEQLSYQCALWSLVWSHSGSSKPKVCCKDPGSICTVTEVYRLTFYTSKATTFFFLSFFSSFLTSFQNTEHYNQCAIIYRSQVFHFSLPFCNLQCENNR